MDFMNRCTARLCFLKQSYSAATTTITIHRKSLVKSSHPLRAEYKSHVCYRFFDMECLGTSSIGSSTSAISAKVIGWVRKRERRWRFRWKWRLCGCCWLVEADWASLRRLSMQTMASWLRVIRGNVSSSPGAGADWVGFRSSICRGGQLPTSIVQIYDGLRQTTLVCEKDQENREILNSFNSIY